MPSQQQLGTRDEEAKTRHVREERKTHLFREIGGTLGLIQL